MAEIISEPSRFQSVLKLPPAEQMFSNPLLMHLLLKNFDTQDILRAALVSKDWCAKSREFLKSKDCRIPMCARVKHESPCRKLAELNEFLKTSSSSDAPTITFNGIQFISVNDGKVNGGECQDCLFKPNEAHDKMSIQKLTVKLYDQILKTLKFKYIRLNDCHHRDNVCPSAQLVNFIFEERRNEVIELDYDDNAFVLLSPWNPGEKRLFPNLTVLGVTVLAIYGRSDGTFPITAPSLRRITDFTYNPSNPRHCYIKDFPHHAVTILGDGRHGMSPGPESVKTVLKFVSDHEPKIERLHFAKLPPNLMGEGSYGQQRRSDLFELGRRISPYLKILKCSSLAFVSLTSVDEEAIVEDKTTTLHHRFQNVEQIELHGSVGVNFMDRLNIAGYYKDFPKLREVEIDFSHPTSKIIGDLDIGPINSDINCRFPEVKILKLLGSQDLLFTPLSLLQMFPHLRILNMNGLIGLMCDSRDDKFAQTINGLENHSFLEEIYFTSNVSKLSELKFDHLFQVDVLETEAVPEMGRARTSVFKPLVTAHSKLKKIAISYKVGCQLDKCFEETDFRPETFLVTERTSEWIQQYRPGFSISLALSKRCLFPCKCELPSYLLFVEKLKPFISVMFEKRQFDAL